MAAANYFEPAWVAPYYARGRPDVHTEVADRVRARVASGGRLTRALDVGCGTGVSTAALASFAASVVGVDPSAAMLAHAPRRPGLDYVRARAEALPFAQGAFDLVGVACAFHWCDRDALAAEARRVLRPGGWLVVYHSTFRGQTPVSNELTDWLKRAYYRDMTLPPRSPRYDAGDPLPGFAFAGEELVEEWVPMTLDQLVAFLLTQSSPVAAIEAGRTTVAALEAKLRDGLAPFFPGRRTAFRFESPIAYLRRT